MCGKGVGRGGGEGPTSPDLITLKFIPGWKQAIQVQVYFSWRSSEFLDFFLCMVSRAYIRTSAWEALPSVHVAERLVHLCWLMTTPDTLRTALKRGIQVLLYDWQLSYPWAKTADGWVKSSNDLDMKMCVYSLASVSILRILCWNQRFVGPNNLFTSLHTQD